MRVLVNSLQCFNACSCSNAVVTNLCSSQFFFFFEIRHRHFALEINFHSFQLSFLSAKVFCSCINLFLSIIAKSLVFICHPLQQPIVQGEYQAGADEFGIKIVFPRKFSREIINDATRIYLSPFVTPISPLPLQIALSTPASALISY